MSACIVCEVEGTAACARGRRLHVEATPPRDVVQRIGHWLRDEISARVRVLDAAWFRRAAAFWDELAHHERVDTPFRIRAFRYASCALRRARRLEAGGGS